MKNLIIFILAMLLFDCNGPNHSECDGNCYSGFGTKRWKDGSFKKGHWKDGELQGNGVQYWGSLQPCYRDTYFGEFVDGLREGHGTYRNVKQDWIITGEWKRSSTEGYGKAYFGAHDTSPYSYYEGEWHLGKFSGQGKLIIRADVNGDKDKYVGCFVDGLFEGSGTYSWADGDHYSGNFKNGKMDGKGIYYFKDGLKVYGYWIKGLDDALPLCKHVPYFAGITFNIN